MVRRGSAQFQRSSQTANLEAAAAHTFEATAPIGGTFVAGWDGFGSKSIEKRAP